MGIRIYLPGRVAVEVDGKVLVNERHLRGRQGRQVFAYLICENSRPIPAEELATVIWPENLAPSWRGALSALISRLSRVLSIEPLKDGGVSLSAGFGKYQVHLPADVWIDLEAGTSAIDRAEAALREGHPGQVLGPATVTATIARRSFLPGLSGFWAESQRGKLERQLVRALDCLTEMRLSTGESSLAVESAIEAVALDPYRERSHRLLMRAHAQSGNRASALNAYHSLRLLLAEELGTVPSAETEAVYLGLLE